MPVPTGDFLDLPSWRELVIATALSLRNLDRGIAAAARVPPGTLLLRSDKLTPDELADEVLTRLQGLSG